MPHILVPLRHAPQESLLAALASLRGRADYAEIWLDTYAGDLKDLVKISPIPLLGVVKSVAHGGTFTGTPKERAEILMRALQAGFSFVDLDITENPPEVFEDIPKENLMLSFHDFAGMPDDLDSILAQIVAHNPTVAKIAVTPQSEKEAKMHQIWCWSLPIQKYTTEKTMPAQKCVQYLRKESGDSTFIEGSCDGGEGGSLRPGTTKKCTTCHEVPVLLSPMGAFGASMRKELHTSGSTWGTFAALDAKSATAPGQVTLEDVSTWGKSP